jgi:hypothetical protein
MADEQGRAARAATIIEFRKILTGNPDVGW